MGFLLWDSHSFVHIWEIFSLDSLFFHHFQIDCFRTFCLFSDFSLEKLSMKFADHLYHLSQNIDLNLLEEIVVFHLWPTSIWHDKQFLHVVGCRHPSESQELYFKEITSWISPVLTSPFLPLFKFCLSSWPWRCLHRFLCRNRARSCSLVSPWSSLHKALLQTLHLDCIDQQFSSRAQNQPYKPCSSKYQAQLSWLGILFLSWFLLYHFQKLSFQWCTCYLSISAVLLWCLRW